MTTIAINKRASFDYEILETMTAGIELQGHEVFNVYKVTLDTNARELMISLSDELAEFCWTDLPDLKNLKLTPPSVELFTRLDYLDKY